MTYGLLAALNWGVAILAGAMAARRIGPFRTTLIGEAAGLSGYALVVSITAAVSSAYPVVPLIGGLLLFRERLLRSQAGGAALILAGLVLLGAGS